jgi:hypothetical protein
LICTLSIHERKFTFKHLCWHSITKILRNGPRAHFSFKNKRKGALSGPRRWENGPWGGLGIFSIFCFISFDFFSNSNFLSNLNLTLWQIYLQITLHI